MIRIVSFKWRRPATGFQLPGKTPYGADHVNRHYRSIRRHLKMPFEYVCVTDEWRGLDKHIRVIKLWDKCLALGGCFNRLYVFSPDMADLIGPRFACIDLDAVIVGDITPLFDRPDDFIINSYQPLPANKDTAPDQLYNGGMFMMNAGARRQVWDSFNPQTSPEIIRKNKTVIGSDQAWIRLCLGAGENRWGQTDGIFEARNLHPQADLPADARIVFFAGNRDPSDGRHKWISKHWN